MKTLILASVCVAALGAVTPANAYYLCSNPIQTVGANIGRNPVVQTLIGRNTATGEWIVIHSLADGKLVNRRDQYNIGDASKPERGVMGWEGHLFKNPNLVMAGWIALDQSTGRAIYTERMIDLNKRGAVIMRSDAYCYANGDTDPLPARFTTQPPPQPAPRPVSLPPQPAPLSAPVTASSDQGQTSVLLMMNSTGGVTVPVILGSQAVTMTLDTGAADSVVPQSLADALIASNEAQPTGWTTAVLADGSERKVQMITINRATLGGKVAVNVPAMVSPEGSAPLLGLSALSLFGKFTLDVNHSRLILG